MTQQNKINKLKNKLIDSLKNDELDFGQVLDISSQLARLDPENVRFSIDAGHISRLGRELVGRQETAVSELVKNAFDADAKTVELIFENCDQPGGCLTIIDNGHGMTRSQLIDGFMRISTTDKIHEPVSQWYKRERAGRKGIGRFAAQRLGSKLTLVTQTKDEKKALSVNIDWDKFLGDKELSGIASRIEVISKASKHGTILTIDDLRDVWSDSQVRRIYRYVSDLIQPYPLSKEAASKKNDPGFKAKFYRLIDGKRLAIADEKIMTFDHALAVIEGKVDSTGKGSWSIKSKALNIKEDSVAIGPLDHKNKVKPFAHLRDVKFKAHYFIYDSELIPGQQMARIQDLARTIGGIRVYRNGFRVLPYGETNDDWLGLDASTRARKILPPHANNNFFGLVELKDSIGKRFEETSSREGLIINEAFVELRDFISPALKAAVLRIASSRAKKQTAGQDWTPKEKPTDKVRKIADNLADAGAAADSTASAASRSAMAETLQKAAEELDIIEAANLEEIGMLRVLASLGLTIGQFTHEVRHYLPALRADLDLFIKTKLEKNVHKTAVRMDANLRTLSSYTAYFDKAVSDNIRRELKSHDLVDVVNNFVDIVKPLAKRAGIEILDLNIKDYDLATRPMHPSEWASILFNLYTNSKKAIRRTGSAGRILIRVGKTNGNVYLEFIDNGDGIPAENASRIFDAFFTTTPAGSDLASEDDEIAGTGLGLKIIKDIITSANGTITIAPPPARYSTCFRIEIPAATVEED